MIIWEFLESQAKNQLSNVNFKIMKKLKLLALGISLYGAALFGMTYLTSSEAEAQGEIAKCEWDGKTCTKPKDKAPCGCKDEGAVIQ